MSVILVSWEAKIGKIVVQGWEKDSKTPISINKPGCGGHSCNLSYKRTVNRRIVVQDGPCINKRPNQKGLMDGLHGRVPV
jgi:hypothetical protein